MAVSIATIFALVLLYSYSIYCLSSEVMEMDQDLLNNISETNKEWNNFDYQKYWKLKIPKDRAEENKRDYDIYSTKFDALNQKTASLAAEIMTHFQNKYNSSVISSEEKITFDVRIKTFKEKVTSNGYNSDHVTIDADVIIEGFFVLNHSIPFNLLRPKGAHMSEAINCSHFSLNLNKDKEFPRQKQEVEPLQCFAELNTDSSFNGSLLRLFQRIKVELDCGKDFTDFPFDTANCDYYFRFSFPDFTDRYITDNMSFHVYPPFSTGTNNLDDYSLEDLEKQECHYFGHYWTYSGILFKLRRKPGYYMYTIYLPISLLVFVSWLSFFLGTSYADVQMRLGLVVTILLTLITVIQGSNQYIPKISKFKALDEWAMTSVGFVIAAIVVTVVNRVLLWGGETKNEPEASLDMRNKNKNFDEENQDLDTKEKSSPVTVSDEVGFIGKCILWTRYLAKWVESNTKNVWANKYSLFAQIINISSATLFPVAYIYFAYNHIEKYYSFERLFDN